MKKKAGLIFGLFISVLFITLTSSAYEQGVHYRVVYFNPDVTIEDPIAAVSAMKPFTDFLGKKLGVVFEPFFFKKQADVERFIEANEIGFGIFSQMFIVENYKKMNFEPFSIALKEGKPYYRKVILVRKDSPYNSLEDLRGKVLATTALGEDNIPFLNKVVFRDEIDVTKHFGEMKVVDSANSAIMAVLYKQADAAAANYLNFVFLKELNPQVEHQLKSIFTSAQTPLPGLVYYKDNVPEDMVARAKAEMLIMHESPIGQQTMLAFQVEAWGAATIKDWEETATLLNISLTGDAEPKQEQVKTTSEPAVSSVQPTPVPVSAEPVKRIDFPKITAIDDSEANLVRITALLSSENTQIDEKSVTISYKLSSGDSGNVPMAAGGGNSYSGEIKLPAMTAGKGQEKTTYTIRPGDTMGKIAKRFLGDSRKYMLIATLNNIKDPNLIQAGAELTIMSGDFTGFDINYTVTAKDLNGSAYTSKSKFVSVAR